MKTTYPKTPRQKNKIAQPVIPEKTAAQPSVRLDNWLSLRRNRVLVVLLLLWAAVRITQFVSVAQGPLYDMYRWQESDSGFFDQWARALAGGDWLNRQVLHPYHGWHREVAEAWWVQHPEQLAAVLAAHPERDSSFEPGHALWDRWYGGNTYHQEPLYAYVLAVLYALTGKGVYWMLALQHLLGLLSGLLLWRLACRYFGDTVALLSGLLYLFCGVVLFQEALLLRTSWTVFFSLLTAWSFTRAFDRPSGSRFFQSGVLAGLAFLLQATFLLFLVGVLALYGIKTWKTPRVWLRHAGLALGGLGLAFLPVLLRNVAVGAPLFSESSTAAVTFVAANTQGTKTVATWMPDVQACARLMGASDGHLGAAAAGALATHPSVGSYACLAWDKFVQSVTGVEWPNNENFYFYEQMVPVLRLTFLDGYGVLWLGLAGLCFGLFDRKNCGVLYLAIGLQWAVLIGFYVLGRFRTPLLVLLLPFAGYALTSALRLIDTPRRVWWAKTAVLALGFYVLIGTRYRPHAILLDSVDYAVFYEMAYYERVKANVDARRWPQAIAALSEFLDAQPEVIRKAKPGRALKYANQAVLADQFSQYYDILSFLYESAGDAAMARKTRSRCAELKAVAELSNTYRKR